MWRAEFGNFPEVDVQLSHGGVNGLKDFFQDWDGRFCQIGYSTLFKISQKIEIFR